MIEKTTKSIIYTKIHGVGSSPALDTSGEIVSLEGLDCGSLIGAPFSWEHKNDQPNQLVGKILEYKKIFSEDDCENEHHKYFFDKCKGPYLYVMGRLFDDKKESSKECAALFLDDAENPDEPPMVGFSVEGSKINKTGIIVDKSVARRITITNCPANKQCVAELLKPEEAQESDIDSIFKSEPIATIELVKAEPKTISSPVRKPPVPVQSDTASKTTNAGKEIGKTSSGHSVYSHAKVHDYPHFGMKEHDEAAAMHQKAAETTKDPKLAEHHLGKMKLHLQAARTAEKKQKRFGIGRKAAGEKSLARYKNPELFEKSEEKLEKALAAGSSMAAPQTLTQGAALGTESLERKKQKTTFGKAEHLEKAAVPGSKYPPKSANPAGKPMETAGPPKFGPMPSKPMKKQKSLSLIRAEEEYQAWSKREEFESYMAKRMPGLTKGEIKAIGQALCLQKSIKAEKKLAKEMRTGSEIHSFVQKKEDES